MTHRVYNNRVEFASHLSSILPWVGSKGFSIPKASQICAWPDHVIEADVSLWLEVMMQSFQFILRSCVGAIKCSRDGFDISPCCHFTVGGASLFWFSASMPSFRA